MSTKTAPSEHVDQRLRTELIMWLGTVRPDGRPHLVPIWFLWDGETILFFSQPKAQKVRNLRRNPAVMLSLDSADHGEDIVLIEGRAELIGDPTLRSSKVPDYIEKYRGLIAQLGWTPDTMAAEYSQPIRVTPLRFRAWGGEQESGGSA